MTYKDTTQVAQNMWVSFIWIKPIGKVRPNMLKLLVIYLLNKLALCSSKGQLFFKVMKRNHYMAAITFLNIDLSQTWNLSNSMGDYILILLIPSIPKLGKTCWSYKIFYILKNYSFQNTYIWAKAQLFWNFKSQYG